MPIRSDPIDELVIPDGTTVEEHDLVTDGDVIVGGQSTVEFGVRGNNVIAGERVTFGGDIEAAGDCRLDMWSDVDGNVLVGEDAYLGERVHVDGELKVAGNVDIGDDVTIEDHFEASGNIVIRNPMPTIVFLVVYLSHLLRIGEEEAAEEFAEAMMDDDVATEDPVLVPRGGHVSDDAWRVSAPATVGDDCRLHGNVRAASLTVGADTVVFGSLRAREDVTVGEATEIKGDVTTRSGDVYIEEDAHVWGDVSADDVELHETAIVEGTIRVSGELTQVRDVLPEEPDDDQHADADDDSVVTEREAGDGDADDDATEEEADDGEAAQVDDAPDDAADPAVEAETPAETGEEAAPGSETTDAEQATLDGTDYEPETIEQEDVVPMAGLTPAAELGDENAENGHDEDAEVVADAE